MSQDISFELERFEWASPDRLEVEGTWHGVRRRLPRATLVVEVEGERRRLRALPGESPGSADRWAAAFPWEGEMPRLPGAELEVGRGIVVDLPRPRRSKVGAAAAPAPLPATTREERESFPGREEADRLLAVLAAARTEADEARARAEAAEGELGALRVRAEEADALRVRAEDAEVEAETLRTRVTEAESELVTLRGQEDEAADVPALRERVEAAEGVAEALRAQAQEAVTLRARVEAAEVALVKAEAELATLRAAAEEADAELTAFRAAADDEAEPAVAPELERLRSELQAVERERLELRAQLDATAERLAASEAEMREMRGRSGAAATVSASDRTADMPGPRTAAAGGVSDTEEGPSGSRFGRAGDGDERPGSRRRPAQRTARPTGDDDEAPSGPPITERISDWVTSLTGSRAEPQNGHSAETEKPPAARPDRARAPRTSDAGAAARTRRRADSHTAVERQSPSWLVRVAAVGLLALLMLALVVIVLSLLGT